MTIDWTIEEIAEGERAVRDLLAGALVMPALLLAHEIGLFVFLEKGPRRLGEVAEGLTLQPRAVEGLLSVCASSGLVEISHESYALSPFAQQFFVPSSPLYFGSYWDLLLSRQKLFSYQSLKEAVLTDTPSYHRIFGATPNSQSESWAQEFTQAMHARGQAPAKVWPSRLDLSSFKLMLDLGGGSGIHSMEAVHRWPKLQAVVLEREPVCAVARRFVEEAGLEDRVGVQAGDFWDAGSFPRADLHFYSEVFHNHSLQQCQELADQSFAGLPAGGGILVHEILQSDDKSGPPAATAASLNMLLWSATGKQHTAEELHDLLRKAGFSDIITVPACGYFSVTSGVKAKGC